MDTYTKGVLTVIAVALVSISFQLTGTSAIQDAKAYDSHDHDYDYARKSHDHSAYEIYGIEDHTHNAYQIYGIEDHSH